MPKPTDIAVVECRIEFEPLPFRAPLKFGGRILRDTQLINVTLRARTADGKEGTGHGSMPLGNVWSWPSATVDAAQSAEATRRLAEAIAADARQWTDFAHPLDHGHALARNLMKRAGEVAEQLDLPEPIPPLTAKVAASPVDAALHDAFGKANGINSFNGLSAEFVSHDLAHYLTPDFAGEYLDQYTLRQPKPTMPLYHLVGALDPLTDDDVATPVGDGLPETLPQWIEHNGLTHLKIKLQGDDLEWDVDRVTAIDRVAQETQHRRGCKTWWYSLDFNERCGSVDYVLEFLTRVTERAGAAMERIQYIEQPTHRDLKAHPENRMHAAAAIKPVVIDESLLDLESLLLAMELGYSGVALKACKGHGESLLLAAAAQKYGLFLCVQDLTCPGASFLHSAELAARIPHVAAIEGNGRQYCPAGNRGWDQRYPTMFHITDGTLGTAALDGLGLGHT